MIQHILNLKHSGKVILLVAGLLCWLFVAGVFSEDGHDHPPEPHDSTTTVDDHAGHDHGDEDEHAEPADQHEGDGHENCDGDHAGEIVEDEHDHDEHGAMVQMSRAELDEFGVKVDIAGSGPLEITVEVPGEIGVNEDRLAHIIPRFPGIVVDVRKNRGDRVSKGDVLAIVESNEGLVPYEVKSLIDGTVIDKHITLGEVMSDAHPAFVIASLDTVWVNLDIYQTHLSSVAVGQSVTLSAQDGIPDLKGRISYISPVVDEHTRATSARVVIPNVGGKWRPGMFVTGRITVSSETVPILVPGTALQSMETHSIVFVETHEGFEAREVQTGRTAGDMAEIIAGLNPGEMYVSKGGFTLKAELMKGGFDDGHNH